jgi:hypothetical protein
MEDEEKQVRNELSESCMSIAKEGSCMFDNIDSFVELSRENTSIKSVGLYPFDSDAGNYEFWDKVGQIVGNFMELKLISIHFLDDADDGGDDVRRPDWEIFSRSLLCLRRKVALSSLSEDYDAEVEDIQGLASAINGHPMISEFDFHSERFTFENFAS